ncbi:Protein IWS1 homolog 1 [Linum grandiflorum]
MADDPYRDEDGEPLMDYDDIPSDGGQSPGVHHGAEDHFLDEDFNDGSRTPVYDKASKPRKRLVKKSGGGERDSYDAPAELLDDYDDRQGRDGSSEGKKRKKFGKDLIGSSGKERKRFSSGESQYGTSSKSGGGSKRGMYSERLVAGKDDGEVKEMWDTIAGGDSEDDQEGLRNMDDDNFIDDTGVDPADRYDEPHSPGVHPQAEEGEEDDEVNQMFKIGKKKKKNERSPAEVALLVENVMAELEVTAEEDANLNIQGKPAINKLKKLPLLIDVLSKKQLQQEFIDHGVLTLLKNWLEPLPDGSLPNINIRAAMLRILTDLPLDLEQYDRREQLKKSGLGKVIMFLSKSDEETTSNRKMAKDLVDKWSRPIFNKSTRFEDMRGVEDDRAYRRPPVRRPVNNGGGMESRDGDLDLDMSRGRNSGQSSSSKQPQLTTRPEATPLDFIVRPQSKIDPEEVRARAKQGAAQDQRRAKMNKKLQQLKAPKKKNLQASRLSVEGRGMIKYL